ncbi:hypothetical protein SmJEL517_g04090 [Synchytrium microbalum]|uniref:Protein phosphatase methylesterase 1 n=1 Tax=Synchytrium microbalum TaxID=1806994 RepID=A0A507C5Y7_9FUNG|nr:uncharacterized protein SmJEL517_g04090 [Synchytrium microbalum]TPX32885.1 hypothetical protein SmJEL517_g04090 [Synchytrium microbalum]
MSALQKYLLKSKTVANASDLPPTFAMPAPMARKSAADYEPLPWQNYFDSSNDLNIANTNDAFRVYQTRGSNSSNNSPLFYFHHGGGHSGLTWALAVKELKKGLLGESCSTLCFDCRGHGATRAENESDLSLSRLSNDCVNVINAAYPELPKEIVLVGHSMGGAVVVDVASRGLIKNVIGVVVLDIVEGTAMESLNYVLKSLLDRPPSFPSIQKAIEWSLKHGGSKNMEAARISIPSQIRPSQYSDDGKVTLYSWRTDLTASEPYWTGWYDGMSSRFLAVKGGRLIILAGTDRLDKTLMIGQMQGKFQMVVLNEVGHSIQEDAPTHLARQLEIFYDRNKMNVGIKRFVIPLNPAATGSGHQHEHTTE